MPDFNTSQTQLNGARAGLSAAQAAAAQAGQQVKALQSELAQLARQANPLSPAVLAEQERLQKLLREATTDLAAKQSVVATANANAIGKLVDFTTFTDPRTNVSQFNSRSPFLLVPVRIETRFVAVDGGKSQLWVRIYPDDFSIDTFEATLSVNELAHAKAYLSALWAAGKVQSDALAAWSTLVSAVGTGRASFIADTFLPVNPTDQPAKASPTDQILVIVTRTALSTTEATATSAYWRAIWLNSGDATQNNAALSALNTAVGAARASVLIQSYVPFNLADVPAAPATRSSVAISVAYLVLPPDPPTQQFSWSLAPRVNNLADRFVVLAYSGDASPLEAIGSVVTLPLYVGPDPSVDLTANPTGAIHPDGENIFIPDQLNWMFDFDQAVAAGMGLKIDLTPAQARDGFDRLLVLGIQLSLSSADGKNEIETLIQHHHYGRAGFAIVPQGAPTHNTTASDSGYTPVDDPGESFTDRQNFPLFTPTADPTTKRDGQWLAELLGIDPAVLQQVHASDGIDQMQARAMQTALWPATIGYWMDKLLTPIFTDDAVADARWYFTSFVSGRGSAPAIRVGHQPYGILPTTAFSRIGWLKSDQRIAGLASDPHLPYLKGLFAVLQKIGLDWAIFSKQVEHVASQGADAQQTLLSIISLHPNSVEFYSRYAETLTQLLNTINLGEQAPNWIKSLETLSLDLPGVALLARLGYTGTSPDIIQQFFLGASAQITHLIDDRPLAENRPVRAYTDDGRNYIQWLIDSAKDSLNAVYQEQGFSGGNTPPMLLYLFLRHALMVGYHDTSYNLYKSNHLLSDAELAAMKPEPTFIHIADSPARSESRFATLFNTEPVITSSPTALVSDFITSKLATLVEAQALNQQLSAMRILANASTASLERNFVEHLDCCTYRYDAWLLGLVNFQLQHMRGIAGGQAAPPSTGTYVGAYGWVENLRPTTAKLTEVRPPADLVKTFSTSSPLRSDSGNGGYVFAPSLAQANTAAILRSGYLANASSANPSAMAVNLSSDRVRLAMSTLEGIRGGQSLGALLGYQFERGLHDDFGLAEVDQFIYPLRKAFPLVADQIASTATDPGVPIEAVEARNVLDGAKLVAKIRAGAPATYPFGLDAVTYSLPSASPSESDAINSQVTILLDIYDAISDLALAEGVFQAVQGNFDRVGGTLEAYTTGNFPPDPQVVQTPSSGIGLTHRFAIHLKSGLAAPPLATPRATAEPALDDWLVGMIPTLNKIQCLVTWTDPVSNISQQQSVSLGDLTVRPIDLLSLIKPDDMQSMSELDDRIVKRIIETNTLRPDTVLTIQYMSAEPGKLSVFQAMPLLRSLKAITGRSRALRATDSILTNNASHDANAAVFVDASRITDPMSVLDDLKTDIGTLIANLTTLNADPTANQVSIISGIDGFIETAVGLLARGALFNLDYCGWGFAFDWKRQAFTDLIASVTTWVARWNQRLTQYTADIAAYDALPTATSDSTRLSQLRMAESLISTTFLPTPSTPADLRVALNAKSAAYLSRLNQFEAVLTTNTTSFAALMSAVAGIATADLDATPLDLTPFQNRTTVFAQDLQTNLAGHAKMIQARIDAAAAQLAISAAAAASADQAEALQAAAQALFGNEFVIYPEFSLTAAQGAEWSNAVEAFTSGSLIKYLTTTAGIDFPVEEWLSGVARVRPNIRSWEQLIDLTTAFSLAVPTVVPTQFPFEAGASWLAMQFPNSGLPTTDHLLYTAYYASPFNPTVKQCGILLDEWTEVIPSLTRDTALTFNFNLPNSEAPQSLLLVTPASANDSWQWLDLVAALNDTLDLAKKRAVEPAQIDASPYSRFLPATAMAVTLYGISISTGLAAANKVFNTLEARAHA